LACSWHWQVCGLALFVLLSADHFGRVPGLSGGAGG